MKTLRICFLLVVFLLMAGLGSARAQLVEWARGIRSVPDTAAALSQASTTDASGNTYSILQPTSDLSIGGVVFPRGPGAAIILKYDNAGALLWAKRLNNLQVTRLAPDNVAGGVFVVGNNNGNATWDGVAVPAGSAPRFYAKCSGAGQLLWSNPLPASYLNAISEGLVADDAGNAYLSGTVGATSTVAGTPVNIFQSYVLKTNSAGVAQWVQVLHSDAGSRLPNLMLGPKPSGGCLVSGVVGGTTLYLGAGTATPLLTLTVPGAQFLTSFDAGGTPQWTQQVGTPSTASPLNITAQAAAADANGNCYLTGSVQNASLGGTALKKGFFLAKYDAAGALQWARDGQTYNPAAVSAGQKLAVNNDGANVVVSSGITTVQIGALELRTPYSVVHFNDLGVAQWAVADAWPASPGPFPAYLQMLELGQDAAGSLYLVGATNDYYGTASIPNIQLGTQTVVGKAAIVARINAYANTLRGQVYVDQNANGQRDAGEGLFPRQLTTVLTQGGSTTYTAVGINGSLQAYADAGAYTLGLTDLPQHYAVSQPLSSIYSGTFSGTNQLLLNQDFGIAPTVNQTDLRLVLTPYSAARAGLTTRYRLKLENVGTSPLPAGTATLTLDAQMQYVSSTPAGAVAGRVVSLNYAALPPFGSTTYDVLFSLPTNTPLGAALSTTAAAPVAGDVAPADNAATLAQTVVGPYDPNSIEVNYQRLTPAQVAAKQPLDYTIHFQNLGSAPAQNVILSDTLDFRKLNPTTLMLVAQSHNCSWSLTSIGPNTGLLTVQFLGINLPEQNADVIRSMGFVRFRVQPRPTLAVGEIIPNRASIVFDYNAGIRTNTATTTVFVATAALASHTAPAWEAYPNPATDVLNIAAALPTAGPVRVELFDGLGRAVRRQTLAAPAGLLRQQLDLRGLAPGLYVLRLTPPTGPALSRQVVRE
ncbi:T9SS type A sorting domain-containing protein [Hymenobacter sp. DH14]|uniref:T9SS type A sorting domain-containing protein n=1 Tax=Hymenobacter cyanobacteriorum TaxID=2926463 RepID=A0A9X1VGU1_9BACT|nr:T9SS type A sorting domain-containing protein [Hymenobacter cyanobacteriorum]MCI1188340.1 T9SS type A sorting domain-containing protein [Hymenobacter cyanobacteriorum]